MLTFAIQLCTFTIGAMLVFGAVVAPTVFQRLEPEPAGVFLRALFPRLYAFCGTSSAIAAALCFAATQLPGGLALLLVSVLFFVSRGPLTTRINAARDEELAGVEGAKQRFDKLHKLSVRIFGGQALILLCTAIYLGQ